MAKKTPDSLSVWSVTINVNVAHGEWGQAFDSGDLFWLQLSYISITRPAISL